MEAISYNEVHLLSWRPFAIDKEANYNKASNVSTNNYFYVNLHFLLQFRKKTKNVNSNTVLVSCPISNIVQTNEPLDTLRYLWWSIMLFRINLEYFPEIWLHCTSLL